MPSGIIKARKEPLVIISASLFLLAGLLGLLLTGGTRSAQPVTVALEILLGFVILGLVFVYPVAGLGITITSTAIIEALPRIPLLTTVAPLIGVVTLLAYLVRKRHWIARGKKPLLTNVELCGFLFIAWAFIPHPSLGLSSWFATLVQLWVLAWLARRIMRAERDYLIVGSIFAGGVVISAGIAVMQTGIGGFDLAQRAEGLTGGANTASRYFVYGIVLLSFLQGRQGTSLWLRLPALAGVAVLLAAISNTVSRSGIVVLGVALILLARRMLVGRQRTIILWLIVILGVAWLFKDIAGTNLDPERLVNAVVLGTDTVGLRYTLWSAGWSMWLDHPVSGVGMGQYGHSLLAYWRAPYTPPVLTPHNTYIQILAETGLVGFILFVLMIVIALKNFWSRAHEENPPYAMANWIWFVVLVTLLVGGITKTDVADKLLWFAVGLSANERWI